MDFNPRSVFAVDRPRLTGSLSLGHGVNEFFSIVIPPVIPLLVTDLGITYAQAGLLLTVFFAMYSVFQLPAGILADRVGKDRLLILGLGGMSVGIFLASMAPSFALLLTAQAITGVFGSTTHPTGMAIISDAETTATEGRAMGIWGAGGKVGSMGAPLLVGGIATVAGWRVALAGAAVGGILVTIALIPVLKPRGGSNPPAGTVRGAVTIGTVDPRTLIRSVLGNIRIPMSKPIVVLFCITILISIQSRAIQTFTTAYVVEGTAVSVLVGNVAFFALLLGGGVVQLISGSLADTYNRGLLGAVASVATAVLVGGTVLFTVFAGTIHPWVVIVISVAWLFFVGGLMYATSPIKNALVSNHAEAGYSGGLFGVIQTGSAVGSATGPVLFGVIATEWGLLTAYPVIAVVSLTLAGLFLILWWVSE